MRHVLPMQGFWPLGFKSPSGHSPLQTRLLIHRFSNSISGSNVSRLAGHMTCFCCLTKIAFIA